MAPTTATARELAVQALGSLRRTGGRPMEIIESLAGRAGLAPADRGLLANLVFGVIRNLRLLDHLLDRRLERPDRIPPPLREILRVGAFQLLFTDRIPDRAALHTSVDLARRLCGGKLAALTNAVLRRIQAEGRGAPETASTGDPLADLAVRLSYPDWMARRWAERFGEREAVELMASMNIHPPLTLRVNPLLAGRDEAAAILREEGFPTRPGRFSPAALVAETDRELASLPSFGRGLFSVQDEAFQLIGTLLPLEPGGLVLDAFAGLGGKSTHLAQRWGGAARIYAADLSRRKLLRLEEERRRLSAANLFPLAADARRPPFACRIFDGILLDAPCSGTGVIRRRPDIKWNRAEGDLRRLSGEQGLFIEAAAALLKPGGRLLYATCSLEPEENEGTVLRFLEKNDTFLTEEMKGHGIPPELISPDGFFRSLPHRHGIDGAFAALLRKK